MFWKILLSTTVSASVHLYVWWRLVHTPRLPWRRAITIAMIAMFLLVPITTSARLWAPSLATALGWIVLPWLAFVGLAAVALAFLEIPRAVTRKQGISRREFMARAFGGGAAMVAGASVARGMISARGEHEIVDVEVKLAKLPRTLDGFSIVQLSDLHTGMTIDRDFVQRVVDRANALNPDLVALTGDLVDGPVDALRDHIAPLAQLRAKHGVFAITGNHEYYAGADEWIAAISQLNVRYLRNERVTIYRSAPLGSGPDLTEAAGDGFDLAGVDDHSANNYQGHGEDLPRALAGRDPSRALVLLAHQPRQVRRASKHGVDLQLSGHTHGGQIWPWHYIVRLQQGGLLAGSYQVGGTQLYVTRGCGYWGPPVRVLAPLEITRVILRAV